MPPIVAIYCINTLDPPVVVIILAGQVPITIPRSIYDMIFGPLNWPEDPCNWTPGA
jgi:hypothetical protein